MSLYEHKCRILWLTNIRHTTILSRMTHLLTVKEARERHSRGFTPLTQEELAAKSGVDQTYISLIERFLRNPSDDIKRRLAKALGIAPARLRFSEPDAESVASSAARVGQSDSRRSA